MAEEKISPDKVKKGRKKRKYIKRSRLPKETIAKVQQPQESEPAIPVMRKRASFRFVMIVASSVAIFLGAGSFVLYIVNQNIWIGVPGVVLGIAGFFLFRYYWRQEVDTFVEHIPVRQEGPCNTLSLYRNKVCFENVDKPLGFPHTCDNDGKKYYVMIHDLPVDGNSPSGFILPDQIYRSPEWFAERPLSLPAHRKLFTRREKMGQYIKTGLLVIAIIIIWILIITTTGGK